MPKRTAKRRLPRAVRVSYEPNRLADACLADAYAQIAPVARRGPAAAVTTTTDPAPTRRVAGGRGA